MCGGACGAEVAVVAPSSRVKGPQLPPRHPSPVLQVGQNPHSDRVLPLRAREATTLQCMPREPRPLSPELGEQFAYAEARAVGVSRKRLRAGDLEAPFRGVRRTMAAPSPNDHATLARDRMLRARVLRDARAYARALAADLAELGVAGICSEALHYLGLEHGYAHERYLVPLGAQVRYLLGVDSVAFTHLVRPDAIELAHPPARL